MRRLAREMLLDDSFQGEDKEILEYSQEFIIHWTKEGVAVAKEGNKTVIVLGVSLLGIPIVEIGNYSITIGREECVNDNIRSHVKMVFDTFTSHAKTYSKHLCAK